MNKTPIEWTDYSVNPFKMRMPDGTLINVCIHKSDGCRNCYAEMIVRRWWKKEWGEFPGYTAALLKLGTPVLVEEELQAVLRLSNRIAKGKADPNENKLFWNDMTDEFLEFWPDEFLDKVWAVRALTPNLIHQVLTKRIDRARDYLNNAETRFRVADEILSQCDREKLYELALGSQRELLGETETAKDYVAMWPLLNVHLGVSAEDQKTADERIPLLLHTPAAVRWLSVEPLLGKIYLNDPPPSLNRPSYFYGYQNFRPTDKHDIGWVVVGGESGPGARPMETAWLRSIVQQCRAASVPVFVKQLGAKPAPDIPDYQSGIQPVPIERLWPEHVRMAGNRIFLNDKKGGDINEWPKDLQVREFPKAVTA